MASSVITRKGQVTIPKVIRDEVNWQEGDRLVFVVRDGEVVLKHLQGTILDLEGSVEPSRHPEDFDAVRREVQLERAARASE